MLYFELLYSSRPRALAARVNYVKLLPTLNKDYLSIYLSITEKVIDALLLRPMGFYPHN